MVLNAQAVALVNNAQESHQKFGQALELIVGAVKLEVNKQPWESSPIPPSFGYGTSSCAVCGGGSQLVISDIVDEVRSTGNFAVSGLLPFWNKFAWALCASCKSDLSSIETRQQRTKELLTEAVELDPSNQVARGNLNGL